MRMYITTANYLNLHKTFLCFEKYIRTDRQTVSKTDGDANWDAIKGMQLKHTPRSLGSKCLSNSISFIFVYNISTISL